MIDGVDYSTPAVNPVALAQAGIRFAGRYLGPGSTSKHLTADELARITKAGLSVVSLVEGASQDAKRGYQMGRGHAIMAEAHGQALGMPSNRPFYFAIDWDVQPHEWATVWDYLRGATSVIGHNRVGVYGGRFVIDQALSTESAKWLFQTYAWSRGVWATGAHIHQYRNGVTLAGGDVDLCTALTVDFGQWGTSSGAPGSVVGGLMTQPADVWNYAFSSPSESMPDTTAGDWLKYAHSAYVAVVALRNDLASGNGPITAQALTDQLAPIVAAIKAVDDRLTAVQDAPLVDAAAVANAISASPDIVTALAKSVAGQLATIVGELTLSGSLAAGIRPPA